MRWIRFHSIRHSNESSQCQYSILCHSFQFRDGPHVSDRRLNRLCGDVLPLDVTSTGNAMHVKFVTDLQNSRSGFRVSWISRKKCLVFFVSEPKRLIMQNHAAAHFVLLFILFACFFFHSFLSTFFLNVFCFLSFS